MKNLAISLGLLVIFSCGKQNEKLVIDDSKASTGTIDEEKNFTDSTLVTTTQCYVGDINGDSAFISIDDNLGTVSGRLYYKFKLKDKTFGELVGTSAGDTIKTDYMSESEGKFSTREIWFLKKDGKLHEATGKYDASGEKYADVKHLSFGESFNYKAADCKTVENALNSVLKKSEAAEPVSEAPAPVEKPQKEEQKTVKKTAKTDKKTGEQKSEINKTRNASTKNSENSKSSLTKTSTETKNKSAKKTASEGKK